MVARSVRLRTPGRDNELVERIHLIAQQPMCAGFTVSREGLAAITSELDDKGRLFGFGVFCVEPQRERVLAWWSQRSLDKYLARFRLRA